MWRIIRVYENYSRIIWSSLNNLWASSKRVFVFPDNLNWHSKRTNALLTLFYNHHHHHYRHTAAWVRANTSRQQWNNSIWHETFDITRALLFVFTLVHFTFRVNDERAAKVCANEEEVLQVSICEGANEYAANCLADFDLGQIGSFFKSKEYSIFSNVAQLRTIRDNREIVL